MEDNSYIVHFTPVIWVDKLDVILPPKIAGRMDEELIKTTVQWQPPLPLLLATVYLSTLPYSQVLHITLWYPDSLIIPSYRHSTAKLLAAMDDSNATNNIAGGQGRS